MRKLFTFLLALFALTAMADKVVFHEDFSAYQASGPGSDFKQRGSEIKLFNSFTHSGKIYASGSCVCLATQAKPASLTTKPLTEFGSTPVEGTLTFKAAPWNSESGTTVKVTISGAGQISKDGTNFSNEVISEALTAKQWTDITFRIKDATSATRLEFTHGGSHKRFFFDEVNVTAKITGTPQTLSFTTPAFTYVLGSTEYAAANNQTVQAVTGAKTTVTYTSNNSAVAKIENGKLVLGTAGTATITATAAAGVVDGVNYFEASASYTVTVVPSISIPFTYNGNGHTLPAGLIGEGLGDYSTHPHIKFATTGSSLTFHLPNHSGLTFWYDYKENGGVNDGTFHVQTSTDGVHFTNATPVVMRQDNGQITRYAVTLLGNVRSVKLLYNKVSGNIAIGALHVAQAVPFTITDAKYATFMAGSNVYLPPAVKACIVEAKGNGIKVKELVDQVVNANVPVLLQGEAGTYAAEPDVTATGSNTFAGNLLKGSLTTTTITAPAGHKFYVLNKGSKGVGFYWEMGTAGNSVNLQAGHAYLSLPISGGAAQGFSLDTPTVTGVEAVETIPSENAPIYDLSGRRVTTPTHGIYIVGGKKVLK